MTWTLSCYRLSSGGQSDGIRRHLGLFLYSRRILGILRRGDVPKTNDRTAQIDDAAQVADIGSEDDDPANGFEAAYDSAAERAAGGPSGPVERSREEGEPSGRDDREPFRGGRHGRAPDARRGHRDVAQNDPPCPEGMGSDGQRPPGPVRRRFARRARRGGRRRTQGDEEVAAAGGARVDSPASAAHGRGPAEEHAGR